MRKNSIAESARKRSWSARRLGLLLPVVVAGLAFACSPGPAPPGFDDADHGDILIASTEPGGGRLAADFDFSEEVSLPFNQCFGGTGSTCSGGIALYSSEDPGFEQLEADEPEESFYVLDLGTVVSLEITELDPEASLFLEGVVLDEPGKSVELPAVPDLHTHGQWQLALPGGTVSGTYQLSFKLTTSSPAYGESEEYTVLLRVADSNE